MQAMYCLTWFLQPSAEREQKDYDGMVDFGFPELAKYGITSFSDARNLLEKKSS